MRRILSRPSCSGFHKLKLFSPHYLSSTICSTNIIAYPTQNKCSYSNIGLVAINSVALYPHYSLLKNELLFARPVSSSFLEPSITKTELELRKLSRKHLLFHVIKLTSLGCLGYFTLVSTASTLLPLSVALTLLSSSQLVTSILRTFKFKGFGGIHKSDLAEIAFHSSSVIYNTIFPTNLGLKSLLVGSQYSLSSLVLGGKILWGQTAKERSSQISTTLQTIKENFVQEQITPLITTLKAFAPSELTLHFGDLVNYATSFPGKWQSLLRFWEAKGLVVRTYENPVVNLHEITSKQAVENDEELFKLLKKVKSKISDVKLWDDSEIIGKSYLEEIRCGKFSELKFSFAPEKFLLKNSKVENYAELRGTLYVIPKEHKNTDTSAITKGSKIIFRAKGNDVSKVEKSGDTIPIWAKWFGTIVKNTNEIDEIDRHEEIVEWGYKQLKGVEKQAVYYNRQFSTWDVLDVTIEELDLHSHVIDDDKAPITNASQVVEAFPRNFIKGINTKQ